MILPSGMVPNVGVTFPIVAPAGKLLGAAIDVFGAGTLVF